MATSPVYGRSAAEMAQGLTSPTTNVASPALEGEEFLSPQTLSSYDEYAANPRFLELQDELRSVLFTGITSQAPSRCPSPTAPDSPPNSSTPTGKHTLDLSRVSIIPRKRTIAYLKNWITECAPFLDKFDKARSFGVHALAIAQESPALLFAILAFSARQWERKTGQLKSHDSLELYQESIRLLSPSLQAKDPNVLITVCILACLELMSASPRDWRRHVEGCATLFVSFGVSGLSGGMLQAVFWCYARMDLIGAIMSNGTESLVLPIGNWTTILPGSFETREYEEDTIKSIFLQRSVHNPDMYANWAVYLCAKTCDLACRRTRYLELNEIDDFDKRPFADQWQRLWDELQFWNTNRHAAMLPIKTTGTGGEQLFPEIFFAHPAAISGNQLYHTACIMMLSIKPVQKTRELTLPYCSAVWHARRVCGISLTNPHSGCLINAIQPLYVAGKLLSHRSEHIIVARLFKTIEDLTGWGSMWRLKDLERAWGYKSGEIVSVI